MSDFPPSTQELFETFDDLQEWDERYDFIIDLGRELPTMPGEFQTQDYIVEGCMSTVWMKAEAADKDSVMQIRADSCLLYTSPSPRDQRGSRMPSSA